MEQIQLGKYRHFKGNEYEVIGIAKNSENPEEEFVVYKALYGGGQIWIREKGMFSESIERNGKVMKRFEFIG